MAIETTQSTRRSFLRSTCAAVAAPSMLPAADFAVPPVATMQEVGIEQLKFLLCREVRFLNHLFIITSTNHWPRLVRETDQLLRSADALFYPENRLAYKLLRDQSGRGGKFDLQEFHHDFRQRDAFDKGDKLADGLYESILWASQEEQVNYMAQKLGVRPDHPLDEEPVRRFADRARDCAREMGQSTSDHKLARACSARRYICKRLGRGL